MKYPLVYELNTRCWLRSLSDRAGRRLTLGEVPDTELDYWQEMGFTHLWLMGVWTVGAGSRAEATGNAVLTRDCLRVLPDLTETDVGGSPYAIAAYEVSPELGGDAGLARLRRQMRGRGLKLMLDFVANHVGLDHAWVTAHPEWFVHERMRRPGTFRVKSGDRTFWVAHGRDPHFPPWGDTAQLDFRSAALQRSLIESLHSVCARGDAVRCDMAMLSLNEVFARTWSGFPGGDSPPPGEFWAEAIQSTRRAFPEVCLVAEAYWGREPELVSLGFDFVYDKPWYDHLVAGRSVEAGQHLRSLPVDLVGHGARFLENHDELRIAGLLTLPAHRAAALATLGLPGLRLLHEGQLTGARKRLPVQLLRRPAEPADPIVEAMYARLLGASMGTSIGRGEGRVLISQPSWQGNPSHENLLLVQWQNRGPEFDLVAVNLAPHRCQGFAPISVAGLSRGNWRFEDLLGDERFERDGAELSEQGLYLDVAGHAAQLFHARPVQPPGH
ncbi:MAG: alpha-amylase family glycosyl hydrolase [Limisphaerales bacterium]